MGLYDNVRCLMPDDEGKDIKGYTFQTKDLECYLTDVVIRENGRLYYGTLSTNYKFIPGPEDRGDPEYKDFYGYLMHGYIRMYDRIAGATGEWIEYHIKFTDGVVESITRI